MLSNNRLNRIIKENIHNLLLFESQESDSQKLAKNLYQQKTGCTREEADNFVRNTLRNDITSLRDKKIAKFTLGVTRMFLDRQINNANIISDLNTTLKLLTPHINEYDKNLNNLSAQQLIDRFKQVRLDNLENEKNEINNMSFGQSNYNIVRIDTFEQAKQYKQYTYSGSPWCLTYMENMFNSYTSNGINQIYFCLRNGFENIKPEVGANAPLDEYGLSMLSIIVNENGELAYCTSRWNHENGGNDSIMSPKQISEVVGVNFYNTFKPNGKWNELITNIKKRLANGENPKDIFDWVRDFYDGFFKVKLNDKYNFINTNGKILCDQWFDYVDDFYNGFSTVRLNDKWNFINTDGKIIFDQWFDDVWEFHNGFSMVRLNDKGWNFINTNGEIISNQWFDDVWDFYDGFAKVKLNGKWNFINTEAEIVSNQWFDWVEDFDNGFAAVRLNKRWYFLRLDGILCDEYTKEPLQESKINNINNINNINMKQSIRLTESELHNIIKESVKKLLRKSYMTNENYHFSDYYNDFDSNDIRQEYPRGKQGDIKYSWDKDKYDEKHSLINKEMEDLANSSYDYRDLNNYWSDRELKQGKKNMNKWVRGEFKNSNQIENELNDF